MAGAVGRRLVITRLLLGDDDAEDVLVVDDADDRVAVDHPARAVVVEHHAGGVADDLVWTAAPGRRVASPASASRITHLQGQHVRLRHVADEVA